MRGVAAWAWTFAIFVLLWMPPPPPPELVWPWWDSLVHTGLMTGFGALWTWQGTATIRVLALGAVVGAVTEIGQGLLPWERHSSWGDLAFDLLGVVLGWAVARRPWRTPRRPGNEAPGATRSAHSDGEAAAAPE
jgi:VanZ family protein